MTEVFNSLVISKSRMLKGAEQERTMSNLLQALMQKHFEIGPVQAGRIMRLHVDFDKTFYIDATKLTEALATTPEGVRAWHNEAKRIWWGALGLEVEDS